jgi:hypothetical protein
VRWEKNLRYSLELHVSIFFSKKYWQVALMRKRTGAYRVLVEKHEGRRPLGRPRRRWEDNIKMDLGEVES